MGALEGVYVCVANVRRGGERHTYSGRNLKGFNHCLLTMSRLPAATKSIVPSLHLKSPHPPQKSVAAMVLGKHRSMMCIICRALQAT